MTEILNSILGYLPGGEELLSAMPVILSLILIEGLLSVDNAMAIAAMASHLPKDQQKKALRYGIIGAYAFRGICLFFVVWIASNPWLKIVGSLYLIYLMTANLCSDEESEGGNHKKQIVQKSLFATIVSIEVMDLSLSVDNVVAAVALDKRLWVICTGVFIGILTLRFVAGHCIKLIEKFPILQKTAFLLIGFVGIILFTEICLEYANIHFHINSFHKFLGICVITITSLLYGHTERGKRHIRPIVKTGMHLIRTVNMVFSWTTAPLTWAMNKITWLVRSKKNTTTQA